MPISGACRESSKNIKSLMGPRSQVSPAAETHLIKSLWQPGMTVFSPCFPLAHKTSSLLCEHESHVFMGCLLAAAGQVRDKG